MKTISDFWLFFQCAGLLLASTMAAGGGQFPGNSAGLFVYIKFGLFLAPILTTVWLLLKKPAFNFELRQLFCDNITLCVAFLSITLSLPLADYPAFSVERCLYTFFVFAALFCLAVQYRVLPDAAFQTHIITIGLLIIVWLIAVMITGSYPDLRSNIQAARSVHPNMLSSLCAQVFLIVLFAQVTAPITKVLNYSSSQFC